MDERALVEPLTDADRARALERSRLLQPCLEEGVLLMQLATAEGLTLRRPAPSIANVQRQAATVAAREGWPVNHERIYRLCREEGLSIRTKHRKRRVSIPRFPLLPPVAQPNERCSIHFLTDSLVTRRRFQAMTIVDNVSWVSPAIEVHSSITGSVWWRC